MDTMCAHVPLAVTALGGSVVFFNENCYGACARCRRFVAIEDLTAPVIECKACAQAPPPPSVTSCVMCERRLNVASMTTWHVFDPVAPSTQCPWYLCDRCRHMLHKTDVSRLSVTDLSKCRDEVTYRRVKKEHNFAIGKSRR